MVWKEGSASKSNQGKKRGRGKRKKKKKKKEEEEKLGIKSSNNQELKLEEKREGYAHEQACSQAQSTH